MDQKVPLCFLPGAGSLSAGGALGQEMEFRPRASCRIQAQIRRRGLTERDSLRCQSESNIRLFPGCAKRWRKIDIGRPLAISTSRPHNRLLENFTSGLVQDDVGAL